MFGIDAIIQALHREVKDIEMQKLKIRKQLDRHSFLSKLC